MNYYSFNMNKYYSKNNLEKLVNHFGKTMSPLNSVIEAKKFFTNPNFDINLINILDLKRAYGRRLNVKDNEAKDVIKEIIISNGRVKIGAK